MASAEIVQLRAFGEAILRGSQASVSMCDKNGPESDNGTGPASDDDSEAIRISKRVQACVVRHFSTGMKMLVQKSNQQRRKKRRDDA
jgi:hypothetical protein